MSPFHRAVYLTGPTASGKTDVGLALSRLLDAEVIAMDSMTLYRGMDIGTAKPTIEERGGVPHHLIDVIDPWQSASVADYRGWAESAIGAIEARGRRALFVGGTPLYLKATLRGLFDGPEADPSLRASLDAEADRIGDEAMHARLAGLDPTTAARLHPNDRRRVVRALEVLEQTGRPISDWQREHQQPARGVAVFAISRPRALLHDRINRRAEAMFRGGLIDEVRALLEAPRPLHDVPAQGVGYREVADYLAGRIDRNEALARTQARTRQFAKRQETWFRGLEEVRAHPIAEGEAPERTAEALALRIAEESA